MSTRPPEHGPPLAELAAPAMAVLGRPGYQRTRAAPLDCAMIARAIRLLPGWRPAALAGEAVDLALQAIVRAAPALPLLRPVTARAEALLIARCGPELFDAVRYRDDNPDVAAAGIDPLWHYVHYGWYEGRRPHPLVDEAHYRAIAGLGPGTAVSTLGHYLAVGRSRGLEPAPWFDAAFYAASTPEVGVAREKPFSHFLRRGQREGRAPAPGIDPATLDPVGMRQPAEEAVAEVEVLARLAALPDPGPLAAEPLVDIAIPVHGGRVATLRCLASVLSAHCATPHAVLVVDDASPDPVLAAALRDLARRSLITLLVNPANRGFVVSMNRCMTANPSRDVVWLNADTEVFGDWIDRLRAAAYAAPDIATATPLTNNGTICSYPIPDRDNNAPLELGWDALDGLAAHANAGVRVDLPTAVGFACYVRRDAIEAIGLLDEAAFGRGYGEENDFCQRGRALGWRDVAAADVFVHHVGGGSFGAEKAALIERALATLRRRHPGYLAAVRAFQRADSLAPARAALDRARLARLAAARNVLLVTHARGGGTHQHVADETARLTAEGASVFVLSAAPGAPRGTVTLRHATSAVLPSLAALDLTATDGRIEGLLAVLGIGEICIHHLVDFHLDAPLRLLQLAQATGAALEVVLHDFYSYCPRINLADRSGMYCGEPDEAGCRRCLLFRRSPHGAPDIAVWRAAHGTLLAAAQRVRVPSADTARRIARRFPALRTIEVMPHDTPPPTVPVYRPLSRDDVLRVATLGAIGPIKGLDVLMACARHVRRRHLPVAITVIGHTANDIAARAAGLMITGRYANHQVHELIERTDPHVIFFASTWPETYSYTLSLALASGRPVALFDIGAGPERLRSAGHGLVLPLSAARDPGRLLDALRRHIETGGSAEAAAPQPVLKSC